MAKSNVVEVSAEVIEDQGLSVSFIPAEIKANFDDLNAKVDSMIAGYTNAVYDLTSQETIKQAKRDRTYLNGIVKEIDDRRKAVKRDYMRPYNEFEARANEITNKVKEASNNIKAQLDEAEERRKEDLFDQLKQYYEDFAGVLVSVVPYERIHDPKWLNKTFGVVKAQNEIEKKTSKIASDWDTLKSQKSMGHYDTAERVFFETLDLGEALNAAHEAEEKDRRIAELREAVEEIQEEQEPEYYEQEAPETITDPEPEPDPMPEPMPEPIPVEDAPEVVPAYEQAAPAAPNPAPAAPPAPVMPAPAPRIPCVMIIEAASTDQMAEIGAFCGTLNPPVSGRFIGGTIEQAYIKLMSEVGGCYA